MRWILVLGATCALGCAANKGAGGDGGADGGAADLADGSASAQGAGCVADPQTGATLCAAISLCPSVVVDRRVFPRCGFRINGQALDLQCACDGDLCPMGAPATCDQAARLLFDQSEGQVCAQVNEGRCFSSRKTGGGTLPSTCDRACAADCHGSASCMKLCGC
jgi:hypothetical protein